MNLVIDEQELKHLPITIDLEIVSGASVFKGTHVPVETLLSNLEAGLSIDEFLEHFPTVTRRSPSRCWNISCLLRQGQLASRPLSPDEAETHLDQILMG